MEAADLRTPFRNLLHRHGHWSVAVEHGRGGTPGLGDVLVLVRGYLLPVELKIATLRGGSFLRPTKLQAQQIQLMDSLASHGGAVRLIMGLRVQAEWQMWMQRDCRCEVLKNWRDGWCLDDLTLVAKGDKLLIDPMEW